MKENNINQILLANPDAPTNDEYALNFARKLFPQRGRRGEEKIEFSFVEKSIKLAATDEEEVEWCGEYTLGLLEATLVSTLISENAKEEIRTIIVDGMPALDREKTIGHFHLKWTESSTDSRDNVTEADIDATAVFLNECWDRYSTDFRRPKANLIGGEHIVDVEVYYNAGLHGSTSSSTNKIFLNSSTVVADECRRQTVSAHELFHRVQYSYGYVTGTAGQKWWVEGTASWSQNYTYDDINDYVNRVNWGLNTPDSVLLDRSYDACHYWKYFGEQLKKYNAAVTTEHQALKEFISEYSTNGLDAKSASGTISQNRISKNFNRFFQSWSKANYMKDLKNFNMRYEYLEDEEVTDSCSRTYGPYRHIVPVDDIDISSDIYIWTSSSYTVKSYGTDYFNFNIDPTVSKINIGFEGNPSGGSGIFSTHLILIKNERWVQVFNDSDITSRSWELDFEAQEYDRCVLVVNGLENEGMYNISINSCMSGTWIDNYNYTWTLTQSNSDITGTVDALSCGTYNVTGTIIGNNITLSATGTNPSCCDFEYTGTIVDCKSGSGNWTNSCGLSGSWTMTKTAPTDAKMAIEEEKVEFAIVPATKQS